MFNKVFGKKRNSILNAIDDSKNVVRDFVLRSSVIGFEMYRPVDYYFPEELSEKKILPLLDKHLQKLLEGQVDSGNSGELISSLIYGCTREALVDLNQQKVRHGEIIKRLITRSNTDRKDLERIREERVAERKILEAEYNEIRQMIEEQKRSEHK